MAAQQTWAAVLMPMRRTIAKIHRWCGLALALWIVLQSASGFALVFKDEVRSLTYPRVSYQERSVPVGDLYTIYRSSGVGGALERIEYPLGARMPYTFRVKGESGGDRSLYLADDRTLVGANGKPDIYAALFSFHDHVFLDKSGRYVVAGLGLMMILFSLSGAYLWWPTRKRRALKVKWNGPVRMRFYDLHRVTGILLMPLLIVSAVTGLLIVFRAAVLGLVVTSAASETNVPAQLLRCEQASLSTEFLNCLEAASGKIKDIRFQQGGAKATLLVYADDSVRPGALNKISVSLIDRQVTKYAVHSRVSPTESVLDWMYPIHTGAVLGWLEKLVMAMFASAVLGLVFFSVIAWGYRPTKRG